jgi:hypothetical protein
VRLELGDNSVDSAVETLERLIMYEREGYRNAWQYVSRDERKAIFHIFRRGDFLSRGQLLSNARKAQSVQAGDQSGPRKRNRAGGDGPTAEQGGPGTAGQTGGTEQDGGVRPTEGLLDQSVKNRTDGIEGEHLNTQADSEGSAFLFQRHRNALVSTNFEYKKRSHI